MSEELERLQTEGHIEKLSSCSDEHFISPIVITVKKDQSIKLALDSKVLNKAIHKNKYQTPNIEMLIDSISQHLTETQDGQQAYFTTLDLKYAYSQLKLHQDTAKHCNFNIICDESTGTYRFKTSFYGLTDMPAEFQKAMDYTLIGLQNRYIPHLAQLCHPPRPLLKKSVKFVWTDEHTKHFNLIKVKIANSTENSHYNPKLDVRVKCDASRSGLGAALEQNTSDGWKPIAFASRFLKSTEERYSVNELELLGIVWSIDYFKYYLYGKNFTVVTDHRALLSILKEH